MACLRLSIARRALVSFGLIATRVEETIGSIQRVRSEVHAASGQVQQLAEQSREIGKVLDVIRAVADEVKNLARRTRDATQEIQDMLERRQASGRLCAPLRD